MSGTTWATAAKNGIVVAAQHLLRLGKSFWGWQNIPGMLFDAGEHRLDWLSSVTNDMINLQLMIRMK